MKLKEGMVLREIAGSYIAVPTGTTAKEFHKFVRLNKTGRDVWNGIAAGLDVHAIAEKMVQDYDGVTQDAAEKAVQSIINTLINAGLVTE